MTMIDLTVEREWPFNIVPVTKRNSCALHRAQYSRRLGGGVADAQLV